MEGVTWRGGERERASERRWWSPPSQGCTSTEAPQQSAAGGHEQIQSLSLKPLDFLTDMRARSSFSPSSRTSRQGSAPPTRARGRGLGTLTVLHPQLWCYGLVSLFRRISIITCCHRPRWSSPPVCGRRGLDQPIACVRGVGWGWGGNKHSGAECK